MAAKAPLKVSYCTTCRGRLHHLRETLPANMAAERDNPDVEFVVLDYGSEDGLGAWIKENYGPELQSGRLRYARYETDHFEMAHAKNMAHRLVSGDILCNVDADNFIAPNHSLWLREQFEKDPHSLVTNLRVNRSSPWTVRAKRALGTHENPPDSACGRIAMTRQSFDQLGGYDETYSPHGFDDWDIALRARDMGHRIIHPDKEQWGGGIKHSNEERLENLSPKDKAVSEAYFKEDEARRALPKYKRYFSVLAKHVELVNTKKVPRVNLDGNVGCGAVTLNFDDEPTQIPPLYVPWVAPSATPEPVAVEDGPAEPGKRTDWAVKLGGRTHPQIEPGRR